MITYEAEGLGYVVYHLEKLAKGINQSVFVQTDWDFPGLASTFGWSISRVQTADGEDVASLLSVLQTIRDFWTDGDAPIHKDSLIGHWDQPICRVVAQAIAQAGGCNHDHTDGTITCPECGMTATDFISAARDFLDDNTGGTAEDPGYFTGDNDA